MSIVLAARDGNIKRVAELLDKNVDVNVIVDGYTALSRAVDAGNIEMSKLLLERGAYMDIPKNKNEDSITKTIEKNNADIFKLLLKYGLDIKRKYKYKYQGKIQPLVIIAERNKAIDILQILVENGVDINEKDPEGLTALLIVAYNKNPSIQLLEFLIKNGANINEKSLNGATALMFAAYNNNITAVKLLLEHGADINQVNNEMKTALSYAAGGSENLEIVRSLLENGADPFVPTSCETVECEKLLAEYRWKRLYERDKDMARRYASNSKEKIGNIIPKDIWEIILLQKRREQLCRNLNSDKNKEILKLFALEFGIPVTEDMTKGKICGLLSRYIVYGKNPKPLERVEREEEELKNKVKEIAYKMGLNPEDSLSSLLTQLGRMF